MIGAGGAEEVSVDTGTTETPVLDVVGGTVELTLGAAEGEKDELLETPGTADGSDVVLDEADGTIVPVTEVP